MTHIETARRYQFATQKLIDLKWHLREMEFQAPANSPLRSELHRQCADLQKSVDSLLSDDFTYDSADERVVRVVEGVLHVTVFTDEPTVTVKR